MALITGRMKIAMVTLTKVLNCENSFNREYHSGQLSHFKTYMFVQCQLLIKHIPVFSTKVSTVLFQSFFFFLDCMKQQFTTQNTFRNESKLDLGS